MGTQLDKDKLDDYVKKVMGTVSAGMSTAISAVGDQLGLYQHLQDIGPASSSEIAHASGLNERWLREWLRHQACAGFIEYESSTDRFFLSPEARVVLLDETHPANFAGGFDAIAATFQSLPKLAEAFHTGVGLSYDDHGEGCARGIERMTAWSKENLLVPKILPMIDGLVERLRSGALVADVGCGSGKALVAMALAFPNSTFTGYDTSEHALERARASLSTLGLANISFINPDNEPMPDNAVFDLVTTFDVIHDVPYPQQLLDAISQSVRSDGVYLCEDIRSFPSFAENLERNPMATMMYGFSMLVCMSSSLSRPDGAGLGTLGFNAEVAKDMTAKAGFNQFAILPWDNPMNNFYVLRK